MIIVTGGSGFIGTNLLCYLRKTTDEDILSVDLQTPPFRLEGVDYVKRDVVEMDRYSSSDRISTIYHLAAQAGVDCSHKKAVQDNILGTVMAAQFAKQTGAHVVFASSGAVGAVGEGGPEHYLCSSGYGISKWAGEKWLQTMVAREGLSASICRFSNVYGWQPTPKSVVAGFIEAASLGKKPWITGSGLQERDLIHVYDVVKAITAAAQKRFCGPFIDVSTGVSISMRDLWWIIVKAVGIDHADPKFTNGFTGPMAPIRSHNSAVFGPEPAVTLSPGIRSVIMYQEDRRTLGPEIINSYWDPCAVGFPLDNLDRLRATLNNG